MSSITDAGKPGGWEPADRHTSMPLLRRTTRRIITLALLLTIGLTIMPAPPPTLAAGSEYYVSTTGNDANTGTLAAPWRTLQYAFDQRERGAIPAGATINMRAGIYREPVSSAARDLVVQGYAGETWTIDLSMDITSNWTSVGNGVYRTQFTRSTNPKGGNYPGVARVSTTVHTAAGPNERLAYLFVDEAVTERNWLKPVANGRDYNGETNLPAGAFATDAPDPSGGADFGGMTSNLWLKLPDGSNPASHRIRVGKYAMGFLLNGAANITLRNMKMMLVEGNGIYGNVDKLTVENSEFTLMKNQPMTLWRGTSGHVIRNVHIHDVEYEGIHNESNSSLFEGNTIENTLGTWSNYGPVGILSNGSYNTIRNNTVRNLRKSQSGDAGTAFFTEQWYAYSDGGVSGIGNIYENNWVENNEGGGIFTSGGDNEVIRNNVVINNGGPGIAVVQSSGAGGDNAYADNTVVYHNTVVGNGQGESWGSGIHLQGSRNANVRNNVVYNNRTPYLQQSNSGLTLSNNITNDPLFVNASAGDYGVKANSPAINAGTNVGIAADRIGTARPQGGGYDAGAYEYTTTAPPATTPTATATKPAPTPTATAKPPTATPTATAIAPTATATNTPRSTPSPTGTPPAAAPAPGGLTLVAPLTLDRRTVAQGQVITGRVTYKNTGSAPVKVEKFIIGARPPGGTNAGGPFLDFAPEGGATTLAPGQSVTFAASRTIAAGDPVGSWYAFSTWLSGGKSYDAPAANNVAFRVTAPTGSDGADERVEALAFVVGADKTAATVGATPAEAKADFARRMVTATIGLARTYASAALGTIDGLRRA